MGEIRIHLAAARAEEDAAALEAFLREAFETEVRRSASAPPKGEDRKVVDPVAVAALVLALPSAVLAAADLAERIELRKKLGKLIELAKRLRAEHGSVVRFETPAGLRDLDKLLPDEVLEVAAEEEEKA